MIAAIISLLMLALGLYIKYRFHIQFALLIRKAYKYFGSKREDTNRH